MNKAATYVWKAHDAQGRTGQGKVMASNAALAQAQLRRQGWQSVQVQRQWWSATPRVRMRDVAQMSRQLAALLKAGVPLLQSLNTPSRSLPSATLTEVVLALQKDVSEGQPLHTALARHPTHFSDLYISMVQAGESAGILDTLMDRLAQTLEKNEALRSRVRSALTYPVAVMVIATAVLVMILVFVVPVFQDVFKSFGAELPWATQMVVGLSQTLSQFGPAGLVIMVLGMGWLQRPALRGSPWQAWLHRNLLKMPLLGPLIQSAVVARWTQTLAALLAAGVPLAEALGPVAKASGHPVYERITLQMQRQVAQGSSLSEAMERTGRFPHMIVQLCHTGEETGSMDALLGRAGSLMESELDDRVNALSSLLEPLIIVVLGGLIGGILVAMYLPIFRLGQVF
jgi:type IV pilus assembly protein PilC